MIKTILLSLMMLLYIASAAFAEGIRANFLTVSPLVGGYTFDGVQHQQTRPVYGIRGGYNVTKEFGVEALFDYVQSVNSQPGFGDMHVFRYGGDLLWHFMPDNRLVPYLALGYSAITTDYENQAFMAGNYHFHRTNGAADYGGGVKYFLNDDWALRGDIRHIITQGGGTLFNYEYTVGLTYQFEPKKLLALFQPAPESEEALEPEPEEVTAPPAVAPQPETVAPPAALPKPETEAPAGVQPKPGIAPVPGVQPETGIAPVPVIPPETGAAEEKEAPLGPIPAAEPTAGRFKYCTTLHIEFDVGSTQVRPEFYRDLDMLGDFMKQNPTTTAVIEGHTDNVGSFEANMKVSKRRAETVVDYLAQRFGIERSRLSAKGYGSTRPVADNATDEGKERNRRIEAIIDCPLEVREALPPQLPAQLCVSLQVEFDTGKTDIKPRYHNEIARVGDFMKKNPTTTAVIEGHTDNVGGYAYNMKLSQMRAESVVRYLVQHFGIERSRLSAKGYGYTRRIAYNTTPEGRQKNRRINAIIDCVIKK
ncbi:MAG TPA: OmpA family protein [Geobacteraceae bacterium]